MDKIKFGILGIIIISLPVITIAKPTNALDKHTEQIIVKSLKKEPPSSFPDRSKYAKEAHDKDVARELLRLEAIRAAEAAKTVQTTTPAQIISGGTTDARILALKMCESGNNYANKKNPKYRGAYQYDFGTWANFGGYHDPADAPPEVQDAKFAQTYAARGGSPWPVCSKKAGL